MTVWAAIPGHTRAVYYDKSCSGFECDVGYMLNAEAATIPGHTRAAYCDELCSSFECGVGFVLKAEAATKHFHNSFATSLKLGPINEDGIVADRLRLGWHLRR